MKIVRKLVFEKLIDVNTGKPVEVEVPDDFEIDLTQDAREAGKNLANRVQNANGERSPS